MKRASPSYFFTYTNKSDHNITTLKFEERDYWRLKKSYKFQTRQKPRHWNKSLYKYLRFNAWPLYHKRSIQHAVKYQTKTLHL